MLTWGRKEVDEMTGRQTPEHDVVIVGGGTAGITDIAVVDLGGCGCLEVGDLGQAHGVGKAARCAVDS